MQAFKFRSLVNLDRVLSMIRSGDLWCAPWSELNDPMEGFYFYHAGDNVSEEQRIVANIKSAKLGRYVCSLSARWDIAGLWAYYADDFRGVTLEYDLTNLSSSPNLKSGKVRYRPVSEAFDIMRDQDPQDLADDILMTKVDDWQHEDEIRILSRRSGRLRIPQGIRSVTLGNRMDVDVQEVIANYCRLRNIMVNVLKISADGFERLPFDFTATANRRRQR
jgi:hypothetical protein